MRLLSQGWEALSPRDRESSTNCLRKKAWMSIWPSRGLKGFRETRKWRRRQICLRLDRLYLTKLEQQKEKRKEVWLSRRQTVTSRERKLHWESNRRSFTSSFLNSSRALSLRYSKPVQERSTRLEMWFLIRLICRLRGNVKHLLMKLSHLPLVSSLTQHLWEQWVNRVLVAMSQRLTFLKMALYRVHLGDNKQPPPNHQ